MTDIEKKETVKKPRAKRTTTKKSSLKDEAVTPIEEKNNAKATQQSVIEDNSPYDLAYTIAQFLDEKKGREITLINLNGKTIIADYFVICTVSSTTAVKALTDYVDEKLSKDYKIEPLRRDIDAKWAAIDYGSVILHIQEEETRKFYNIERIWNDGSNLEVFKTK